MFPGLTFCCIIINHIHRSEHRLSRSRSVIGGTPSATGDRVGRTRLKLRKNKSCRLVDLSSSLVNCLNILYRIQLFDKSRFLSLSVRTLEGIVNYVQLNSGMWAFLNRVYFIFSQHKARTGQRSKMPRGLTS